jgi:hypothetical protein
MSDYAATALSFTAIDQNWRELILKLYSDILSEQEPAPALPALADLLVVDVESRRIVKSPTITAFEKLEPDRANAEQWRAFSAEVLFGGHRSFMQIRVREMRCNQSHLEIWFPSRTYETIYNFDPNCRDFSSEAKSDFVRLVIGLARLCGCLGFVHRLADGGKLFGPPPRQLLYDYIQVGNKWLAHADPLILAGIDAKAIENSNFEFDLDSYPMHYRQSGYYLYDILWPRT